MNIEQLKQERELIIQSAGGHENLTIEQRYKIMNLSEKINKLKRENLQNTKNIHKLYIT